MYQKLQRDKVNKRLKPLQKDNLHSRNLANNKEKTLK